MPAIRILCLLFLATSSVTAAEPDVRGRKVYEKACASCHGAHGEGVKDVYDQLLAGDQSVGQLTKYIGESMPEDDPESVVGDDAAAVAAYIHDAFYSEIARDRIRPARIELARLTHRQYEQTLTDLIGQFRPFRWPDDKRGLKAEYYNDKNYRRDKRVIERIDPRIDFDYGAGTPDAEKIKPEEFSIKWFGGVIAPEAGEYEFILQTDNGARLYVNDYETPLIDAWVKSGDDGEYRARIKLLAGRVYPFQVEFHSQKAKKSSIHLRWKPPHLAEQVIPERSLFPDYVGPVFVSTVPFPPDDRSTGYERGTSISGAWYESTTRAALEVAAFVTDNLRRVADVKRDDPDRDKKLQEFCHSFASRAFRRPLTDEEREVYVDRQFDEAETVEAAIKQVVVLVLSSPRFLYREAGRGEFDDYNIASWLSYGLWDSLPDDGLRKAAETGQLQKPEQIAAQARRMVDDPRTKTKFREFFHQWLNVDRFHELAKDPQRFPEFDEQMASDLRTSLDLFLDDVVWSESSDFRELLLSESLYLNPRLAAFYGGEEIEGQGFDKVSLKDQGRAGLLSHPFLMAGFAYDDTTSPIHRGVFLSRSLLGRTLRPPPEAVAPTPPELAPELTTRERVRLQTEPVACQTCHRMINPLGFSLENFDAVGRFRTVEEGQPIDAQGSYLTRDGTEVHFSGVRELATFLASSEESQQAFVEQLFQFTIKQPILAFGPQMLPELHTSFVEQDFNIRNLLVEIVSRSAIAARERKSQVVPASVPDDPQGG